MTKPLPYDMHRCYGKECDKKDQCQRFLTIPIDDPRLLSYVASMVRNGVCNDMIEDK